MLPQRPLRARAEYTIWVARSLLALQSRNSAGIENLNPIAVGVFDESQPLHFAVVGTLDERNVQLFEAFAGRIHIGHHNTNVAEAARLRVAIVVLLFRVRF